MMDGEGFNPIKLNGECQIYMDISKIDSTYSLSLFCLELEIARVHYNVEDNFEALTNALLQRTLVRS